IWSPDDRYLIYFLSELGPKNDPLITDTFVLVLHVVDTITGSKQRIDLVGAPVVGWSPDGDLLAYVSVYDDAILLVDPVTGEVPDGMPFLQTPDDAGMGSSIRWPTFSPDGRHLLFVDFSSRHRTTTVDVRDLTTGTVTMLTTFYGGIRRFEDVVWREDGIWLVEDLQVSSYFDDIVFHHINPATGTRTPVGTLQAEDYIRMVEW
ncbi:MAG: hypothetical protein AAF787_15465, partial [Chloroflexota bacterium]